MCLVGCFEGLVVVMMIEYAYVCMYVRQEKKNVYVRDAMQARTFACYAEYVAKKMER